MVNSLFEGEERTLANHDHRPGLLQGQVDAVDLVVFATVGASVFF
jgi:hypothetical protein